MSYRICIKNLAAILSLVVTSAMLVSNATAEETMEEVVVVGKSIRASQMAALEANATPIMSLTSYHLMRLDASQIKTLRMLWVGFRAYQLKETKVKLAISILGERQNATPRLLLMGLMSPALKTAEYPVLTLILLSSLLKWLPIKLLRQICQARQCRGLLM